MPDPANALLTACAPLAHRLDLTGFDDGVTLITGASGLIGLNLLACLHHRARSLGRPLQVVAVTRTPPPDYLAGLFNGNGVVTVTGDLTDPTILATLPVSHRIIHAAGYGQPGKFLADPQKTIGLNTWATAALLGKLAPNGRFLFVSSSEVYSGHPRSPHRESDIGTTDPSHPRACYIEGKRCGEALCHAARSAGGHAAIARLALAYGPGTRPDDQRVLNSLIRKGLLDRQIRLLDQGQAIRTYCHIDDAVEILLAILFKGERAVYNVGGHSTMTILELAQSIGRALDAPVTTPDEIQSLQGAPAEVALDLSAVAKDFGKTVFRSFDDGLAATIAWQKDMYAATGHWRE